MTELHESARNPYKPQGEMRYTYADYYSWDDSDGSRWELIEGIPHAMSSPTITHQRVLGAFYRLMTDFLAGKPCEAILSPYDVRLNAEGADDIVVQPDLLVVCDRSKIDAQCCIGAPDLIIEILSPSTAGHDRVVKFRLYLQAGVREYWMVDPETKSVEICILQDGQYTLSAYDSNMTAAVRVLPGMEIRLEDVFKE